MSRYRVWIATATPFSWKKSVTERVLNGQMVEAYRPDLFPNEPCLLDLFEISGSSQQSFGQRLHRKLTDTCSNPKSFDTVRPEELITKEWTNNGRDASYRTMKLIKGCAQDTNQLTSQTSTRGASTSMMARCVNASE